MAGDWRAATLNQLGRIVTGKTPSSSRPDYFGGDIPFVTPTDFDGSRLIETTGRCLTEAGAGSVATRIPARAVMVSCIGSDMGKAAIAGRECVTNQQINSVIVGGRDDALFVYYNLSTRKAEIRGAAGGSAQPILNKSAFGRLAIRLPPLDEQRAIAHIIGTLDDKIELNRQMSETLEAMARALFKSWFVDFDPVRAKAAGRDPGLPKPLADLFPARLVDSELGEIPEGWKLGRVGDLANVEKGLSYKGEGLADEGGLPMVNLGCFGGGGAFKAENIKRYRGDFKERHLVRAGDLLVANTDMTQNRIILGSPALLPNLGGEQRFLFTHHTFVFRFKPGTEHWRRYLYFALLQPEFREIAEGFATGTTVLALPREDLMNLALVLPPDSLLTAFERQVEPSLASADIRRQQSQTLAALRDTLLPKLISGELRVSAPPSRAGALA